MNGAATAVPHLHVAVIGAGFSGLGAAIKLRQHGFDDFLVFERAQEIGGTWRDNTYPGAACDIQSQLYCFSFAPNPEWSRIYARQPEILEYLRGLVRQFHLQPHLRLGYELLRAVWDNQEARWQLQTSQGEYTADVVISGHGPLVHAKWPDIPGLDSFAGTRMHSSCWNHETDLRGKRVAVIGTGASAIQFVPAIASEVGQMYLFQRSAPWIVPRPDRAHTKREHSLFRRLPLLQRIVRQAIFARGEITFLGFTYPRMEQVASQVARAHLEAQIPDATLRARLTPDYHMGCKRILVSNDFYPALRRDNVELVTERLSEIRPHSVVTQDGQEREIDVLICGTGFQVAPAPIARLFVGKDGRTLAERWQAGMQAYLGTTVEGFPNLFLMVGPNTASGHSSIIYVIEAQLEYLLKALDYMRRQHLLALEVRAEVQRRYNERLQHDLQRTIWNKGGCTSFYLEESGRNSTLWPGFAFQFRRRLSRFDPQQFVSRLSPLPLDGR